MRKVLIALILAITFDTLCPLFSSFPKYSYVYVEEIFKLIALCFGHLCGVVYVIVFAVVEFIYYYAMYYDNEKAQITFLIIRIICIFMHYITMEIQWKGIKEWRKTGRKCELVYYYFCACGLHTLWNELFGIFVYLGIHNLTGGN